MSDADPDPLRAWAWALFFVAATIRPAPHSDAVEDAATHADLMLQAFLTRFPALTPADPHHKI